MEHVYDVVVIGAGNAALCSALSANENGAEVLVLEKAPEHLRGGNSSLTGGLFRCAFGDPNNLDPVVGEELATAHVRVAPYTEQNFASDMVETSQGKTDPMLSNILVKDAWPTVQWMRGKGVRFQLNRGLGAMAESGSDILSIPPGSVIRAAGQGPGLSQALFELVNAAGVSLRYDTEAYRIVVDDKGSVQAVDVRGPQGPERIACRSIVIASGSFEANSRMRTAYLGAAWSTVKVRGVPFNTGTVLDAAIEVGAQPFGDWSACHATIVDIEAPDVGGPSTTDETSRLSYPLGVLSNLDGMRFLDEGETYHHYTYAKFGRRIIEQRDGLAIEVFDAKTVPHLAPQYRHWPGHPIEAKSLEELADRVAERLEGISFNGDAMLNTIASFNASIVDGPFNPATLDGKRTEGLAINKSNWAVPIDTPPYLAYVVTCGITFAYGGLRVDQNAAVTDFRQQPIQGLFAAGEAVGGIFHGNYPGGTGLMSGAVFGRRAGANAAAHAKDVA